MLVVVLQILYVKKDLDSLAGIIPEELVAQYLPLVAVVVLRKLLVTPLEKNINDAVGRYVAERKCYGLLPL